VVLAGGAGTRFGMPKALARAGDGTPWLHLACRALFDGGCADVVVVLGARAGEAQELVPAAARFVVAGDWATGVAASLRAGLAAAAETGAAGTGAGQARADVAVVSLVDLPGLRSDAVRRVLGTAPEPDAARQALARATYGGAPGHPVLVGRAHWRPLAAAVHGDTGAGPYLRAHGATTVDCTDLGGGHDVDHPG
jgi:CTP:molybdopterin cytidylyltransferase MocA